MRYWFFHTAVAIKKPFARLARARRMQRFLQVMQITGGERIIDLGGTIDFWLQVSVPLNITVLNLPGSTDPVVPPTHHTIRFVHGDACAVRGEADGRYDIAFSNSVIEHVGDAIHRAAMAAEVQRLAPAYWVQTPSIWFPIEAHSHMPFWWLYPRALQQFFFARWRVKLPAWCEMIETTTVLHREEVERLFPNGQVWTERFVGFAKSYVASSR
jgi:hypothetical protein